MNGNLPLVSVIVPNYNHEKYLEQRLKSIFNQTYPNFEVILLDDCSSDKSQEILLEYAKNSKVSHCIFNAINSGNTFVQWNRGMELAKGDYIWIAESDDFCELNFLEELIQPVLEDPEIKLVYCQSNRVDEKGSVTGSWINHTDNLDATLFLTNFVMDGNAFIERFLIYKNVIPNASGVLFQRVRAVELGELDIDPVLKICGDWLFYLKLVTNANVAFIPKSLNNFRYHSASVVAGAVRKLNWGSIIDINLVMRQKICKYISIKNQYNNKLILAINNKIAKGLKYDRGIIYFKNKNKIKGILILFTVLDVFFSKQKMLQNFRLKK